MRLTDAYGASQFGLSIEIFPPKTAEGDAGLRESLAELMAYQPRFVSCTYGAGGSTSKRTIAWCQEIQNQHNCPATAHFTCVGHTREELIDWLNDARTAGVVNFMALRGDPPAGQTDFRPVDGGLSYANELVTLIREHFPTAGIGVGGYPEKHPEAPDLNSDLKNLQRKVLAGADAIYTQLFFDNQVFYRFRDSCQRLGIHVPIIPGIMPITEFARIQRITAMCGASLPAPLVQKLEAAKDDKLAQFEIGVEFAIQQCRDLRDQGIPGLHLYALNKSQACRQILDALGLVGSHARTDV